MARPLARIMSCVSRLSEHLSELSACFEAGETWGEVWLPRLPRLPWLALHWGSFGGGLVRLVED